MSKNDSLAKSIVTLIVLMIISIPVDIYLLVRWLISPNSPITEIFLLGVGVWFLGSLQVVFLVLGTILIIGIWTDQI